MQTKKDISFPIVSLYGTNYLNNGWTLECMKSWSNILDIPSEHTFILPQEKLNEVEDKCFSNLDFKVMDQEEVINDYLRNFPEIKSIREKDVTWRKIIDTTILFPDAQIITVIDTDVFIRNKVKLPFGNFDIIYMREDIPAYRANWKMVWKHKMVPALNAGMVLFDPKIIDFNILEEIIGKYIKDCKNLWWSEQSAWSVIAGKTIKRGVFSGDQVRVTSAMKIRKPEEMFDNEYKYFGGNKMITEYLEFEPYLKGGSIFHFAGPGKYLFQQSLPYLKSSEKGNVQIKAYQENTMRFLDKVIVSSRLFLKEQF
ncbi:hypothetical protein [Autumnicola psychrophila]|uniref:Uncharacterized protein n=1 Tax=Autumnicola psychrophila TaxID=3075592 RepID=A0ABU3DR21_9FLAO|nr:hypothetical protein [Zunongwangia sp. F225]MDT0686053.1 hypothetical protein [Zunongwangia sp. F225]